MNLIVAGSRTLNDKEFVYQGIDYVDAYLTRWKVLITMVLSGGARGVDRIGEEWAREKGIPVKKVIPEWRKYGRRAGPLRNLKMVHEAQGIAAFQKDDTPGTKQIVNASIVLGLPYVFVWNYPSTSVTFRKGL
jgi:hypothetical protein